MNNWIFENSLDSSHLGYASLLRSMNFLLRTNTIQLDLNRSPGKLNLRYVIEDQLLFEYVSTDCKYEFEKKRWNRKTFMNTLMNDKVKNFINIIGLPHENSSLAALLIFWIIGQTMKRKCYTFLHQTGKSLHSLHNWFYRYFTEREKKVWCLLCRENQVNKE